MDVDVLKETIKQELPGLLRSDLYLRRFLSELMKNDFAGKNRD